MKNKKVERPDLERYRDSPNMMSFRALEKTVKYALSLEATRPDALAKENKKLREALNMFAKLDADGQLSAPVWAKETLTIACETMAEALKGEGE